MNYFSKNRDKIQILIKKCITKFKSFLKKKKAKFAKSKREKEYSGQSINKIKALLAWIFEIALYGIGLNFLLWQIFDLPISILKVLAWGLVYYFISAELPKIFKDCRGARR